MISHAKAVELNAKATPIHAFEDGELVTKEEYERRKQAVLIKQVAKSPFLVGTMAEVSKKIGNLDKCLQDYTQLVFDSRMSDRDDTEEQARLDELLRGTSLSSAKHRRKAKTPDLSEREQAEINKFGGVYAIHSDRSKSRVKTAQAVQMQPERVKNVHKISMKAAKKKERKKSADSGVKPKFVELFTFPGYQSKSLTSLPHDITCHDLITKVLKTEEQPGMRKVYNYQEEFDRALYSHMSLALIQDIYWWVFLDKFSSQKSSQPLYFNRIAHNYARFFQHLNNYFYKQRILDYFPDLVSKIIFVAFSVTFPDSYKQFNDDFKEYLIQTIFEWMTGILPAPRRFLKWNSDLEPAGKKREQAMGKTQTTTKEVTTKSTADDWIAQLDTGSENSRLKRAGSEISMGSRMSKDSKNTNRLSRPRGPGSESSKSDESRKINYLDSKANKAKYPRPPGAMSGNKALTPVQETHPGGLLAISDNLGEEQEGTVITRVGSPNKSTKKNQNSTKKIKPRESHPACKGADMVKSLFDVKGSCPLISHYLRSEGLEQDAGSKFNVSRSELKNLPPLDAPTYRQVIKETYSKIKDIEKGIHRHIKEADKQHTTFVLQQTKDAQSYRAKQELLLENMKEVKRLSNLLILDHASHKEKGEKNVEKSKTDQLFEEALLNVELHVPPAHSAVSRI